MENSIWNVLSNISWTNATEMYFTFLGRKFCNKQLYKVSKTLDHFYIHCSQKYQSIFLHQSLFLDEKLPKLATFSSLKLLILEKIWISKLIVTWYGSSCGVSISCCQNTSTKQWTSNLRASNTCKERFFNVILLLYNIWRLINFRKPPQIRLTPLEKLQSSKGPLTNYVTHFLLF